jgi:hypothetical protein
LQRDDLGSGVGRGRDLLGGAHYYPRGRYEQPTY